jgi:hypothetical protein
LFNYGTSNHTILVRLTENSFHHSDVATGMYENL